MYSIIVIHCKVMFVLFRNIIHGDAPYSNIPYCNIHSVIYMTVECNTVQYSTVPVSVPSTPRQPGTHSSLHRRGVIALETES